MSSVSTIIVLLVALNGFLAFAEVALLSARRSRLRKMAAQGNARARLALDLARSPWRFLAVVRLGVTCIAVCIGVIAGSAVVPALARWLARHAMLEPIAQAMALSLVAGTLGLASFFFGEILLKRLAMARPERAAIASALPVNALVSVAGPLVAVLTRGVDWFLRRAGLRRADEPRVTDEEVSMLVEQGFKEGVFHVGGRRMVEAVLALDRTSVMAIMTPRPKIVWLDLATADEVNWRRIVASGHSHFPVCEGTPDRVAGMLSVKALWANSAAGFATPMRDLVIKPLFVPESSSGLELLEHFKRSGRHLALVQDEFGTVSGMVTLIDVLKAIVGDLPERGQSPGVEARRNPDGSWLIDGTMSLADLRSLLGVTEFDGEDRADFQTLGGFVMTWCGRIPRVGDAFETGGFRWEVASMDRFRVDKVVVRAVPAAPGPEAGGDGSSGAG